MLRHVFQMHSFCHFLRTLVCLQAVRERAGYILTENQADSSLILYFQDQHYYHNTIGGRKGGALGLRSHLILRVLHRIF